MCNVLPRRAAFFYEQILFFQDAKGLSVAAQKKVLEVKEKQKNYPAKKIVSLELIFFQNRQIYL